MNFRVFEVVNIMDIAFALWDSENKSIAKTVRGGYVHGALNLSVAAAIFAIESSLVTVCRSQGRSRANLWVRRVKVDF